jgi:hypothetical protein
MDDKINNILTWNDIKEEFTVTSDKGKYSKNYILTKLQEAASFCGENFTRREYKLFIKDKKTFPSASYIERTFKTWNEAKKCALLILNPVSKRNPSGENQNKTWPKLRFRILRRDNFRCQYCGNTPQLGAILVVDHIIPKSKGGTCKESNLTTSCNLCNMGKGKNLL